jgi:3-oxoacyl-[acyl-carrier protein] reductase
MFDLSGKKALVTGASGGIGRQIAIALAQAGAEVSLSGTRVNVLEETASLIDRKTHILPCNLSDLEAVDALGAQAVEAMGSIDILINNAGVTRDNIFMRMKNEQWDEVIAINLSAAFRLSRSVLKPMMKQRYGRIIGISSVVGVTGNAGQANYAASKAGLIGMSKSLASEVASRNITVNTISPGFISSPMTDELNDKQREAILAKIPASRLGEAKEVASCALFLASEEAAYVTGHNLNVNGGMAMV